MDGLGLKIVRIMRGWTQWDLATKVRVHPARINEMERGAGRSQRRWSKPVAQWN
jgi:DNA-binding XRE family transcriptional regulator